MSTEQHLLMSWLAEQFGLVRERLSAIETRLSHHDQRAARTRGWTALLSPKLLPWIIAAVLLASGHLGVADIKALIGIPGAR